MPKVLVTATGHRGDDDPRFKPLRDAGWDVKTHRWPGGRPDEEEVIELVNGYDAVIAYLDRTHEEALDIYRSLTPEKLAGRCTTPAGTSITTWKWLRALLEHEIHHRGQIYLMLGMLGVRTPPLYGLTEEQLLERTALA